MTTELPLEVRALSWRAVAVPEEVWVASAHLAGLRTASNNARRARDRDRGVQKNRLNDIQGALGELLAIQHVGARWPGARVRHSAMDWDGPVDEVDLTVIERGSLLRLEAKCHLDEPQKQLFLVNSRAHRRSIARGAVGYVPIIGSLGAKGAFIGRPVTIAEVEDWGIKTWPSRPEKDPALAVPVIDLAETHFAWSLDYMRARLVRAASPLDTAVLWAAYEYGSNAYPKLRIQRPTWATLEVDALINELVEI